MPIKNIEVVKSESQQKISHKILCKLLLCPSKKSHRWKLAEFSILLYSVFYHNNIHSMIICHLFPGTFLGREEQLV